MTINPPPIHAPWTLDPATQKLNNPAWLKWLDDLVSGQLAEAFLGIQTFQTTDGSGMLSSSRNDPVVTQDDIGALIATMEPTGLRTSRVENEVSHLDFEPTGARSSRNDDDAMIFTMMSF